VSCLSPESREVEGEFMFVNILYVHKYTLGALKKFIM